MSKCPTCGKEYTEKDVERDEKGIERTCPHCKQTHFYPDINKPGDVVYCKLCCGRIDIV